jgi:hypothetical protein
MNILNKHIETFYLTISDIIIFKFIYWIHSVYNNQNIDKILYGIQLLILLMYFDFILNAFIFPNNNTSVLQKLLNNKWFSIILWCLFYYGMTVYFGF